MLKVGLTGGIGSGKSEVARRFEELGVPLIDADIIAREVVEPGEQALQEIVRCFGREILQPEGNLDRAKLRDIVFSDPEAKRRLESILHPRIRSRITEALADLQSPYAVVVIPLLLETGYRSLVDRILVVDLPLRTQLSRVCERDGMSPEEAMRIIDSQASREERLLAADDLVDNAGPIGVLEGQVEKLHRRYLGLARAAEP